MESSHDVSGLYNAFYVGQDCWYPLIQGSTPSRDPLLISKLTDIVKMMIPGYGKYYMLLTCEVSKRNAPLDHELEHIDRTMDELFGKKQKHS